MCYRGHCQWAPSRGLQRQQEELQPRLGLSWDVVSGAAVQQGAPEHCPLLSCVQGCRPGAPQELPERGRGGDEEGTEPLLAL